MKSIRRYGVLLALPATVGCGSQPGTPRVPQSDGLTLAIVGGTVIHPDTGEVLSDTTVLIKGDRIAEVGPRASVVVPLDGAVIDGRGKWIVPGYVDTHVHFFQSGTYFARPDVVDLTKARPYAVEVARNRAALPRTFASWLASGVTSVVDMGGPFWNFDVREQARQVAMAPTVLTTGPLISTSARPELEAAGDPPIIKVSTEEQVVELAKRELVRRPDFLKFWFIYYPDEGDDLAAEERLARRAAIAAHESHLRLAVHATHLDVAKAALRAGADMLVHSVDEEIDDEFLALARARHVSYTPTLFHDSGYDLTLSNRWKPTAAERRICDPKLLEDLDVLNKLPPADVPDWIRQLIAAPLPVALPAGRAHNLVRMWKEGFLVTVGTDAGNIGTLHGPSYFRELALMAEAGLSPAQVLRAATSNGAKFMGRENEVGDVKAGLIADLVVLDANPIADVKNMGRIERVVRRGRAFSVDGLIHP